MYMNKMDFNLIMLSISGDYAMWSLADLMLMGLNSDNPEVYEWSLKYLKELGKLRQESKDDGYLYEHYQKVRVFLNSIHFDECKHE